MVPLIVFGYINTIWLDLCSRVTVVLPVLSSLVAEVRSFSRRQCLRFSSGHEFPLSDGF